MHRRNFLTGLLAAPAVITTPGLLMPVKALVKPQPTWFEISYDCMDPSNPMTRDLMRRLVDDINAKADGVTPFRLRLVE